ncbi:amidohydrolase family protein [Zwartia sp.]|uniref:amidohydrolase family protein n=1 Tax=Zwartia sp. TaxID=2978004 RepID=UPI003BAFA6D5
MQPSFTIPADFKPLGLAGICDCHTHIFPSSEQFPFAAKRNYTPAVASLEALDALHAAMGVDRVVLAHPSPYGTDNSSMLYALESWGPARGRGVAVIDESFSLDTLKKFHAAGVRGVRVNLETHGHNDPASAARQLKTAAEQVAPLGWHVQVYTNLDVIAGMQDTIRQLPTTLVVDHFGKLDASKPLTQPGFDTLCALVQSGKVYVKLSAPYRISELPGYPDGEPFARALIDANPDRMLWGTDWPHPMPPKGVKRDPNVIEYARPEDDFAALTRIAKWAGDPVTVKKVLVDNAARLYDF